MFTRLVYGQIIPAPGKVRINNSQMQATLPVNVDCEEPAIITARDGEQILVLRHFQGKQVVHIYSIHVVVRDIQNDSQGASVSERGC